MRAAKTRFQPILALWNSCEFLESSKEECNHSPLEYTKHTR